MDLTLTDDQELIAGTARDFFSSRSPLSHLREMENDPQGYSDALWKEMAELGWLGMAFPEAYGGADAAFFDLCLVVEQMGRFQVPAPFLPTVVLCGLAVTRFGADEQKEELLGPIARGEKVMTYARGAADAGRGSAGSTVTATPDGDELVLDGRAMFVPYAHAAHELVVVAQATAQTAQTAETSDAVTVVVVGADADGLSVEPLETVRADHHHRVDFDAVRVSTARVLGDVARGGSVVDDVEAHGTAALCAEMVGGAQSVLDMTVEYAKEREQFGRPIGSFQAVQHRCADMALDVITSRLISYEAIWRLSEGLDAGEEVSMAKAWVGEAYERVCAGGHQVHGAIGFTREHDLHYFLRHALSANAVFGDADFHWERLARQLGL